MPRAQKVCACRGCTAHAGGCPEVIPLGQSRCTRCSQTADRARGNRHQRGYGRAHVRRFRPGVLRRDPLCVCTDQAHGHGPLCLTPSTVADHHPRSRRRLVQLGLDPNDPQYGRGLCEGCHAKYTAHAQPGGWNTHA